MRSVRWLVLLSVVTCGCGGVKIVPVSGTVTLDGQPLAGAHISFEPVEGTITETSTATTDTDGRYDLECLSSGRMGAVPGTHRVLITTVSSDDYVDERSRLPRDRVPPRYQDGSLTFEVQTNGNEDADFELRIRG